jgi:pilus assembly protein Flp/PilA
MTLFNYLNTWVASYIRAHFGRSERGASLVEYVLLVSLIAVVCIGAITWLGNSASSKFDTVGSEIGA